MTSFQSDDPSQLEDRVSSELRAAASAIPVSADPTRAVARAEQRRQRRTVASIAAGVVTVAGLGAGALALQPDDSSSVVVASVGEENGATSDSSLLTLQWRATDADVDWPQASFVGSDGYRYALSTAPGARYGDLDRHDRVPQAVYRTADGENWEAVSPGETYLQGLGSRDGVLYSISTSAKADGQIVSSVVRSVDNGQAWTGVELPFVFDAIGDPNGLLDDSVSDPVSLAIGENALIATTTRTRWINDTALTAFLGLAGDAYYSSIEEGPDGARVIVRDYGPCNNAMEEMQAEGDTSEFRVDPEECVSPSVVHDVPLAELDISGDLAQTRSVISADGVTWSPANVPGAQLWYAGGVFIAADTNPVEGLSYSRSPDGVNWSPIELDPFSSIEIVGSSNGILVGRAYRELSSVNVLTLSSDGGATWNDLDMGDLSAEADANSSLASVAAGDLGIVAVLGDSGADPEGIEWIIATSGDGVNWTTQRADEVDGFDAGYPGWAFVDADRMGVVFSGAKRNADGTVSAVTVLGTPTR